jgi:iron complex outermembrane receptor protein
VDNRLDFSIGTKLEHNEFTGFEYQPSARLVWTPDDRNTVWGAVSRALRVPSILEDVGQVLLDAPAPGVSSTLFGNSSLHAEELLAYELGYRVRASDELVVDLAGFYNKYENVTMFVPVSMTDFQYASTQAGESYGLEAVATWTPIQSLTVRGSWALSDLQLRQTSAVNEGDSPTNMVSLITYYDVTDDLELNAGLYWVDDLPTLGVDAYTRLDIGLRWHVNPHTTVSIYGQNLLDSAHPEFPADGFLTRASAEIERSVYGQVSIEF